MSTEQRKNSDLLNSEDATKIGRLLLQESFFTEGMGGVFPERSDVYGFALLSPLILPRNEATPFNDNDPYNDEEETTPDGDGDMEELEDQNTPDYATIYETEEEAPPGTDPSQN